MNTSKIQGQIIRPFSPAIGKYKLPNDTISLINTHVDGILKDQNKIDELYNGDNLAGEIKYEVKITKEFLKALPEMNQLIEKQLLYIDDEKNFKSKTSRNIFFQNQTHINNKAHSGKMYPLDLLFEESKTFDNFLKGKGDTLPAVIREAIYDKYNGKVKIVSQI